MQSTVGGMLGGLGMGGLVILSERIFASFDANA
jgi:hypothetical protein